LKLATFDVPTSVGSIRRIGAAGGDRLVDFVAAYASHLERTDLACDARKMAGLLFPPDMVAILETGNLGLSAAAQAIDWRVCGKSQ
jgi:hypothetical protein